MSIARTLPSVLALLLAVSLTSCERRETGEVEVPETGDAPAPPARTVARVTSWRRVPRPGDAAAAPGAEAIDADGFLLDSFDVSWTSLPPGFRGHDVRALAPTGGASRGRELIAFVPEVLPLPGGRRRAGVGAMTPVPGLELDASAGVLRFAVPHRVTVPGVEIAPSAGTLQIDWRDVKPSGPVVEFDVFTLAEPVTLEVDAASTGEALPHLRLLFAGHLREPVSYTIGEKAIHLGWRIQPVEAWLFRRDTGEVLARFGPAAPAAGERGAP